MLASRAIINQIALCAEWADRLVRADLMKGYIVTENDYTSNFTSAFRREINSQCIPTVTAHSQVLNPTNERITGTDGCIVISNSREFKIGLFEAKWPRLSTRSNYWDSLQKQKKNSKSISHFDSQINRQHSLQGFAIWEMFYSEEAYGANKYFPFYGSACVWHADAYKITSNRSSGSPWTDVELLKMLSGSGTGIGKIVDAICSCTHGNSRPIGDLRVTLNEYGIDGPAIFIEIEENNED